ncbi:MAG: hypothetical protein Nk1A_0720 [Endomicrobiia bacterium]|nr:MAG: hypothetical protein Nk1A_0720 [Endomicrobiia bacterium]
MQSLYTYFIVKRKVRTLAAENDIAENGSR